jgi:hypothetical protein
LNKKEGNKKEYSTRQGDSCWRLCCWGDCFQWGQHNIVASQSTNRRFVFNGSEGGLVQRCHGCDISHKVWCSLYCCAPYQNSTVLVACTYWQGYRTLPTKEHEPKRNFEPPARETRFQRTVQEPTARSLLISEMTMCCRSLLNSTKAVQRNTMAPAVTCCSQG